MNESQSYIISELNKLSANFPAIHIKYGFNSIIRTHVVEITPLDEFINNEELDKAWIPLSFQFREKFPGEEIAFVSSDSILQIKEPEYEVLPLDVSVNYIETIYSKFSTWELSYTFPTSIPSEAFTYFDIQERVLKSPMQRIYVNDNINSEDYYSDAA